LPDQRDERGMLGRVVERIAHPDALENQFRRLADDLGVARLTAAEGARVDFSEPLAEHIGEDLGRIEQESLPTQSRIMGEALPPSLIAFRRRCLIQQDACAPNNPMGVAALTLSAGDYAIRGTNWPGSIGTFASYGCIRMYNQDIRDLYRLVRVGTPVIVEE